MKFSLVASKECKR